MTPKTPQKSILSLSAGPELVRHNSCRPDEYPPYEPVPKSDITLLVGSPLSKAEATFIGHTLMWVAFGMAVVKLLGLL